MHLRWLSLMLPCAFVSASHFTTRVSLRDCGYEAAIRRVHDVRHALFPWYQTTGTACAGESLEKAGVSAGCWISYDVAPWGTAERGTVHAFARWRDESSLIFIDADEVPTLAVTMRVRPALVGACIQIDAQLMSSPDRCICALLGVVVGMRDGKSLHDSERRLADVELDALALRHQLRALSMPTSHFGRTPLPPGAESL